MPKFRTTAGRLTPYALACGYLEQVEEGNLRLTLWHEGACYHVRAHEFEGRGRLFWDSFPTLGEARKRFDAAKGELFSTPTATV